MSCARFRKGVAPVCDSVADNHGLLQRGRPMSRGHPFEPGNKIGRGRPKGSPNKKTPRAQELFEQNSAAIMALAINSCREDPQMLKMLASRIVPRQRELPVKIGGPLL